MAERRKLVLAIDCDDVLTPTGEMLIEAYNSTYGTSVGLNCLYESGSAWQTSSEQEAMHRVERLLRAGVYDNALPFPDATEYVNRLNSDGHELHLVTGRQSFMEPITERFLHTYFPDCFQTIEHTNMYANGDTLHLKRTKGEVCRNIGAHALVDDHVAHGRDVLKVGVERVVIFGKYPWNMNEAEGEGMVRCIGWEAAYKEITSLS